MEKSKIAYQEKYKVVSVTKVHRLWIAIHVVGDYFSRSKARSHSIGPIPAFKCLDSVDPLVDDLKQGLPKREALNFRNIS